MADVIETIGAAGFHATIQAWLSAHQDKDMVALGNRYIGELIDPVYEVDGDALVAQVTGGGTRNSSNYRWLRARVATESNTITANGTPATGGTFTLSVRGEATTPLAYNSTAAQVQAALEALENVGVGNVACVATSGANLGVASAIVTINWQDRMSSQDVLITADFSGLTGNPHVLATPTPGLTHYRPDRHQGPRVYVRWLTSSGDETGFRVAATESFFRASGFGLICEDPREITAGNKYGWWIQGDDFLGSALFTRISEGGGRSPTAVAPFFTCYYINNVNGNHAERASFLNCIAYGSRHLRGANTGFLFDSFSSFGGVYNCGAYSITRGNNGRGFFSNTSTSLRPVCVNCVSMGCNGDDFIGLWGSIAQNPNDSNDPLSVQEPYQCIASDYSLPFDSSVPRVSAARNGVNLRTVFYAPESQDMRPITGSACFGGLDTIFQPNAVRRGRDMSHVWNSFGISPSDFDGIARPMASNGPRDNVNGWTIGPYHLAAPAPVTASPTEEVWTIGTGGDFATIQAFLDATDDQSLFYENKVVVGELIDALYSITAGQRVVARRTVVDRRRYRVLRPASGNRYEIATGIGAVIAGEGGSATGENNLVEIHEDRFRMLGPILVDQTYTGSANRRGVKVTGEYTSVDAILGRFDASTGTASIIFLVRGSNVLVTNCIAAGSNSSGTGANTGFAVQECETSRVYCCSAWGIRGNGSGRGYVEGVNTSRVEVSSCIAADCTTGFFHSTAANSPTTQSNNISSDTTADGPGSQVSISSGVLFRSATTGDFRNASGSPGIKRGRNLSIRFSTDFEGRERLAPFDCGAHEGLPTGPLFVAPEFEESRAFMTLWEIARTDGVVLLFSDQPEPVVYRGRTYDPGGAVVSTNRRDEPDARSVGVATALTSSKITSADIAAKRYRGARLREILLGRYPWTSPIEENVYVIGEVEYDADRWEAELSSLSSLLDRNAGRLITVGCPLIYGSDECGALDKEPNTQDDVRVGATIDDPRRRFNANSADIPGSYADDYFSKGRLTWLTGAASGIVSRVKSYVSSTRTIELEEALPYDVEEDDTFIVEPGCRKLYLASCIAQHSNGINYGGEPFMPGTDKSLSTPTR